MYGKHQVENAILVKKCAHYLNKKKIINLSEKQISEGIKKTIWFGRFHIIQDQPTIVFDVHNDSSLKSFLESFNSYLEINKFEKNIYYVHLKIIKKFAPFLKV